MKPQEYIEEREKITHDSITRLDEVVPKVQRAILEKIVSKIDQLETDSEGRIKPSAKNLKIINEIIRRDARAVFLEGEYEDAVYDFVRTFKKLGTLTRQYFNKIESGRPTRKVT